LEGCRWLDLCTGTGAMGAEALCRGASLVVGIEQSGRACAVIQQNWQQVIRDDQRIQLIRGDIGQKLPTLAGQNFDRIYFDPPYAGHLYEPVLQAIAHHQLLTPVGELAVEHDPTLHTAETLAAFIPNSALELCRYKRYGNTAIAFYSRR
ncbi:MAG: methyltransferase, partial [Leptolyngbyaceae cyanobacterium SL_7_1]|nr:methyltransferase [Leptolyngbyaceae cyanobacterium SL_7_1]